MTSQSEFGDPNKRDNKKEKSCLVELESKSLVNDIRQQKLQRVCGSRKVIKIVMLHQKQ